jgi:hypothetical protein
MFFIPHSRTTRIPALFCSLYIAQNPLLTPPQHDRNQFEYLKWTQNSFKSVNSIPGSSSLN